MTNYEKYKDEIIKALFTEGLCGFKKEYVMGGTCKEMSCGNCNKNAKEWLEAEWVEPTVDWSKVEVDTPILVSLDKTFGYMKRHFAKFNDGQVYAWASGRTSFTTNEVTSWPYAKLVEVE